MIKLRGLTSIALVTSLGILLATPIPAEEPLPMPRVVAPEGRACLAVEEYLTPPKEIADAVLATASQNVPLTNLSPDGKKFLDHEDRRPAAARPARVPVRPPGRDGVRPRRRPGPRPVGAQRRRVRPLLPRRQADRPGQGPGRGPGRATRSGRRTGRSSPSSPTSRTRPTSASPTPRPGESRRITTTPVLATLVTAFQWSQGRQADPDGAAAGRRQATGR